jgi:hypothetical protein
MSVTIITPADFIEHPEDVRSESGPKPPLTLRGEQESVPLQPNLPLKIRGIEGLCL